MYLSPENRAISPFRRLRPRRDCAKMGSSQLEDSPLTLGLRTTGRAAKPISAEMERELGLDDIESLLHERGVQAPTIVQMRERHHALARLIAEGKKPGEAAIICRYSQSRMSILLADPTFQELVAHYRELVNESFVDFQKKLAELAIDAASILQDRMEEKPDDLSEALLLRVVEVGADRTGHGPSQKTEINMKIGIASRLASAHERSERARDITPKEITNGTSGSDD